MNPPGNPELQLECTPLPRKKKRLWRIFLVASILIWSIHAYTWPLSSNPLKAKAQIQKIIPLGTSVKVAEDKMQEIGFKCEDRRGESFEADISTKGEIGKTRLYKNIDFLVCYKEWVYLPLFYDYMWDIAFVYNKDHIITDVLVSVGDNSFVENGF